MQKLEVYAVHRDGTKLFYPRWDSGGEIMATKRPTAAVSIENGRTFPEGSVWIRRPRGYGLQAGWTFGNSKQ